MMAMGFRTEMGGYSGASGVVVFGRRWWRWRWCLERTGGGLLEKKDFCRLEAAEVIFSDGGCGGYVFWLVAPASSSRRRWVYLHYAVEPCERWGKLGRKLSKIGELSDYIYAFLTSTMRFLDNAF